MVSSVTEGNLPAFFGELIEKENGMSKKIGVFLVLAFFTMFNAALAQNQSGGNPEAKKNFQLCKENLEKGNVDQAVECGEKAVQLDGGNWEYYYWLGNAYGQKAQKASMLRKLSYAKKCKAAYKKAVELNGSSVEARLALMSYLLQAPGIAGGDKNKAKEQASEIMKLDALRGHLAFGQIYMDEKDLAKAEQEYIKIIELDPKNPLSAYYQLGRIALLSGKDLEKGLGYFQEYLKVEPKPNNPTWADAHWRMGMIQEKLGNKEQAVSEYQKALKLNPEHKNAKDSLSKIQK
jgi:tetratricopeptide (TPR) repeat protein